MIFDHVRLHHTKDCIKYNFQNIIHSVNYIVFRNYNSNIINDIDNQFNSNAILEHNILNKYDKFNKYTIYWLINASHIIWSNEKNKKFIINIIKNL